MSDPAVLVTAPIGWAKARPLVFVFLVLVVVALTIKYRDKIAVQLARVPGVGRWITGLAPVAAILLAVAGVIA